MNPQLTDSRRLTGANLFWERPSAVIDVTADGPIERLVEAWQSAAMQWLDAVGHPDEQTRQRLFDGGASLLISAPIDALYSMCELNEVAWASALHAVGMGQAPDPTEEIPRLTRLFDEESNPRLLELQAAARRRGLPFLWDDDEVSIGHGATARIWPARSLPQAAAIDWAEIAAVPLALVTGTNGKSTTVRMTAAIMDCAGFNAGLTSTDFIRAGSRMIDQGDYSGPGGARMLLRQPDVDMAVLEVARGGLLRRGLGVERANVAVITNVAEDHLGEYGIHTLDELIETKFIVRRALTDRDTLVLNADDPGVVAYGERLANRKGWFSLDADNPKIVEARASGDLACCVEGGWLVATVAGTERRLVSLEGVTAARNGTVRYNLSNALAAISIAVALGIGGEAIRAGLAAFRGDERDNPGRGNWFEHEVEGGLVRILVDFAHNEHGMRALADTVRRVGADRVVLLLGQAGDRTDREIAGLVRAACEMRPGRLLVAELPGYERGRQPFEVQQLICEDARACGLDASRIETYPDPRSAAQDALDHARPGDLLVLLALTQRREALALVHEYIGEGEGGHG
jgi:UDP-N-acetylmuramyl tripeptide synthase